jgi:hypothetical protein
MSTKQPTRGKLTHDHELLVISRVFDLVATLHQDRREFVVDYVKARLRDMPVIAQVDAPEAEAEADEPPMMPHLRGAASAAA